MSNHSPVAIAPSIQDVHTAYLEELGPRERAALMSWAGFTGTFATVRVITYSIREGKGPFRNLSVGNAHLHHYMWGIGLLTGVGAVAVHGPDGTRRHPGVALSYGVGLALIVDEFALLLSLGGTAFAALPMLQRLARSRRSRTALRSGLNGSPRKS
jgi:hypothetical protein